MKVTLFCRQYIIFPLIFLTLYPALIWSSKPLNNLFVLNGLLDLNLAEFIFLKFKFEKKFSTGGKLRF